MSREEAEDATQIVFFNAYRSLEGGVDPQAEQAWLFKIAEHVVMYRRRTISRRARVEFPSDLASFADSIASPRDVASPELAGLAAALGRIPDAQRRAIVLREWHGLSHREVAAELGITRTAAETLIFRARRRLAIELSESNGSRKDTKPSLLSLLWMKCVGFGTGAKLATGLVLATTVAGTLDHGALLRHFAAQTRPASQRPALVAVRAAQATPARASVETSARRRTVRVVRPAAHLPAPVVVQAADSVTPPAAVAQLPRADEISYPIAPDVPVDPPDTVVNDRGTAAVTADPTPLDVGDSVDVPPAVPSTAPSTAPPAEPPVAPAAPALAVDPAPLSQAEVDTSGTPVPDPASPPDPVSPPEHGVGQNHTPGEPAVPSLPPTASPVAQLALACRRCNADGRDLGPACEDSHESRGNAEPGSSAADLGSDQGTGASDREGDPHGDVKQGGDALLGGGVK